MIDTLPAVVFDRLELAKIKKTKVMNRSVHGRGGIKKSLWLVVAAVFALNFSAAAQDANVADHDPKRFQWEIGSFVEWDRANSYPRKALLFVGSSSIRLWSTRDAFHDYPVINRGFGGAHISDVNYYFDLVVGKYKPAVIVFYAGDNDIAANKSVQNVYEDFVKFTRRVLAELPDTKVIYLAIKPSVSRWRYWESMRRVNALVEGFSSSNKRLDYADVATPMTRRDGKPRSEFFLADGLHLNSEGYRLWESILTPHLARAFKGVSKRSDH